MRSWWEVLKLHEGDHVNVITQFTYETNNDVFTGVFTCQRVTCEDAGQAAYSQLCLHVTGEYDRQQAVISCQNHRNVARRLV